jgi:hypothetical protein
MVNTRPKEEVLARGGAIAEDIADLFVTLLPMYRAAAGSCLNRS